MTLLHKISGLGHPSVRFESPEDDFSPDRPSQQSSRHQSSGQTLLRSSSGREISACRKGDGNSAPLR